MCLCFCWQTYNNKERCIELLTKACQNCQNPVTSPTSCRSTEDLWDRNCGSAESASSVSSSHSVGMPGFDQATPDIVYSHMRLSQSYPLIPPTLSSNQVHNPTPRSSLPMASLNTVREGHHVRQLDVASAAIMRHGPTNTSPCHISPNVFCADNQQAVFNDDRRRVCPGEISKPTFLSAAHLHVASPDERGGTHNLLSHPTLISAASPWHSSSGYSAAYIHPLQAWAGSPLLPTTYISSLSSSRECLPSSTSVVDRSSPSCLPVNSSSPVPSCHSNSSPRGNIETVDNSQYINGMEHQLCKVPL